MENEYMDVQEAAAALGIQPGAVRDAVARGKLAAIRKGGRGERAGFLLIEGEEIERYRRENLGRRGKYARIQPTDIPPVNPGAAKVIVPSDHVSTQRSARREPSTARRGEEVHRHQGGPKVVFRGINGGTYQWTQNAKPRRTSEREIGRWKELGFAVAWIEEATSEMLAAAGALNAKTNHRGASN